MRRAALVAVLVASAAWAGTRFKVTNGAVPTQSYDGVGLEGVVGCRATAKRNDAGIIGGGKIVYHYYDPAWAAWMESASSLHCGVGLQQDGGGRQRFVCPDLPVATRFGRIAISGERVTSDGDGGSPNGHANVVLADGGLVDAGLFLVPPSYRIECWGPAVFQ